MVQKIEVLIGDPALRDNMGKAGRTRAHTQFHKDVYMRQMDELFSTILG